MEKVRADVLDSQAEAPIASFVTACFHTGRHKVVVLGRLWDAKRALRCEERHMIVLL